MYAIFYVEGYDSHLFKFSAFGAKKKTIFIWQHFIHQDVIIYLAHFINS